MLSLEAGAAWEGGRESARERGFRRGGSQTRRDSYVSPIGRNHLAVFENFNQELDLFFCNEFEARQQTKHDEQAAAVIFVSLSSIFLLVPSPNRSRVRRLPLRSRNSAVGPNRLPG